MTAFQTLLLSLNPIGYWTMDETSGSLCADSSGNALDGTAAGTFTRNVTTMPGITPGIELGGASTDHVDVPDDALLDLTGDFAYHAIVSASAYGSYMSVMTKGKVFPNAGFLLRVNPFRQLEFLLSNTALLATSTGLVPNDTDDHQVAVRRVGSTITFFIDGASAGSTSDGTAAAANSAPFTIGSDYDGVVYSLPWDGVVDEVAVFGSSPPSDTDFSDLWDLAGTAPCSLPENAGGSDAPAVTGDTCVGDVLTSDEGTWSEVDSMTTYDFQWQADCGSGFIDLVGETADTLTLTSDEVGCDVRCVVTATNGCGSADAPSNSVAAQGPPVNTVAPVATGSPFVGHSVITDDGVWDDATSFTYQWQLDCGGGFFDIVGETTDTVVLLEAWVGCSVRCEITATGDC